MIKPSIIYPDQYPQENILEIIGRVKAAQINHVTKESLKGKPDAGSVADAHTGNLP